MIEHSAGIIGLGYVGLPLAIEFCKAGFIVIGVDINEKRLESLQKGISYIPDVDNDQIKKFVNNGKLSFSKDPSPLSEVEGISICVPTPLRKTREPDISFVIAASEEISRILQADQNIILESTVYPGATDGLVAPILEKTGLKAGIDFCLAFSPERIDPGNSTIKLKDIPKLVGGINEKCTKLAVNYYSHIFSQVIPLRSAKEAEMAKLLENTFRAVNIGLVNELAIMANHMGINIWEVINAAATKPFGFMPFYPGPGWGGHCIPVDPVYLSWRAKMEGLDAGFIDHAVEINSHMPQYVVDRVCGLLNEQRKPIYDSKILMLGVSYKKNVDDIRESPALPILTEFLNKHANVSYYDPYVSVLKDDGLYLTSQNIDDELLSSQDCVVITTDHSCFDYRFIAEHSPLVFDTRNATKDLVLRYPNIHLL